jgi:hypothetical protein
LNKDLNKLFNCVYYSYWTQWKELAIGIAL